MRRQTLPLTGRGPRAAALGLVVLGALAAGPARAQTAAPAPATATPPDAADTAPPPGDPPLPAAGPVEPLPGLTPAPPSAAVAAPMAEPARPVREPPIYRRDWFWGAVGVVIITVAIIGVIALSNSDPAQPNSRLGDMRAF